VGHILEQLQSQGRRKWNVYRVKVDVAEQREARYGFVSAAGFALAAGEGDFD